ncbi:MAG: UDP-4-amino-4,6-dideoxy-N-acetyl-beta-L-altrosamine transaminase [Hyphomicrobiaceae bacterium]
MTSASPFLPYARQAIDDDDIRVVMDALKSDMLTTGPAVEVYEKAFAQASGAGHAVACNSGTAALHLAVLGLGVGGGDHVIVPTVTFLATANVVRMAGGEVVFADVDPDSGLLTPASLERALDKSREAGINVVGAVPVHLNGQVCDMSGLAAVAQRAGIWLMEDACHALGASQIGCSPGSSAAAFSTHPVKGITTTEGGVVTTSKADMAELMRSLRSHGMIRDPDCFTEGELAFEKDQANPWYYEMHQIGWNYRLPDVMCALGTSQLRKLAGWHQARENLAAAYRNELAPLAPLVTPVSRSHQNDGWHLYPVLIDFEAAGLSRRFVMNELRDRQIGTQVHYIPVHLQPYYRARNPDLDLPGAEAYYRRCLSLPFFATMERSDVSRVVDALHQILRSNSHRTVA